MNTWFTLITIWFWAPAVTFQDWSSYNLTFVGIYFFLLCHPPISPLSTRLLGVRDRCHASLLLEYSVEGPLGYQWLIRHLGDIHCCQVLPHLYLHHQSIGFEGCQSWQLHRCKRTCFIYCKMTLSKHNRLNILHSTRNKWYGKQWRKNGGHLARKLLLPYCTSFVNKVSPYLKVDQSYYTHLV